MTERTPRVSIGLPVFNGARYLARALDSLVAQDFEDFELIISDNASTDGTAGICQEYAGRDRRIRYHRNDRNIGAVGNFNRTLHLASGEYFKWAAHDDWCAPEFLGRCVEVLDEDPSTVLCFTAMGVADAEGRVFRVQQEDLGGAASAHPRTRFHTVLWSLVDCTSPVFGLMRTDTLRRHGVVLPNAPELDRILIGEVSLLGRIRQIPDVLFFHHGPPGHPQRDQWTWMDPANVKRIRAATVRITSRHAAALWRSSLGVVDKVSLTAELLVSFGVRRTRSKIRKTRKRRKAAVAASRQAGGSP
ncbi:MAG: glycosyltransferase family 2 protein [Actinomycetota bacterium]